MILILLCFVLFVSGCSSNDEKVDFTRPVPEFKIRRSKTVRHTLPKFKETNDNGKFYIIKRK